LFYKQSKIYTIELKNINKKSPSSFEKSEKFTKQFSFDFFFFFFKWLTICQKVPIILFQSFSSGGLLVVMSLCRSKELPWHARRMNRCTFLACASTSVLFSYKVKFIFLQGINFGTVILKPLASLST